MTNQPHFRRIKKVEPVIRADELGHVVFERKDPDAMVRFLMDFGFIPLEGVPGPSIFLRAYGSAPYCVEIIPSQQDAFVGSGFFAASEADLERLSQLSGCPIEAVTVPGGGRRVRLTDPDGRRVDVVHGHVSAEPHSTRRELIPLNTPQEKRRINTEVRPPLQPTAVHRIGHFVIFTPDFGACAGWYMQWIGVLPTDVLTDANGIPCLAFFRLDRGAKPSDHHNLAICTGEKPGIHHVSTETLDIDAIGQGQQFLRAKGWQHFWGIGRHELGSQLFDYWLDPVGVEWEHYADGDVMTDTYEEGYYLVGRNGLWTWGDDLPDVTKPVPGAVEGAADSLKGLLIEWEKPARPWLP